MPVHEIKRKRHRKAGDIGALRRVLWTALVEIEMILEDDDPAMKIKAGHALGTLSGSYLKALELTDIAARIARLEDLLAAQQGPQPVKGRDTWAA